MSLTINPPEPTEPEDQTNQYQPLPPPQPVEPRIPQVSAETVLQQNLPSQPAPVVPVAPVMSEAPAMPEVSEPEVMPQAIVSGDFSVPTGVGQPGGAPFQPVQPQATSPVVSNNFTAAPFVSSPGPNQSQAAPIPPVAPKSKKKLLKPILLVLVAVVVLGGVASAAYLGVIKPNSPDEILKTAIVNTAKAPQGQFTGKFSSSPTGGNGGIASTTVASGSFNRQNNSADLSVDVDVTGVSINAEVRYVGQSVYVKFGDLSGLANLASTFDSSLTGPAQSISSQLSNKWVDINSDLLKTAGLSCVMNTSTLPSKQDIQVLETDYLKDPFIKILSTSKTTLNGQSVEKYNLSVNNSKIESFANSDINNVPSIKSLEKCDKDDTSSDQSMIKNNTKGTTPITVLVNKKTKLLAGVGYSTVQDSSRLVLTSSFTYNPTNIVAPKASEPVVNVLTQLDQSLGSTGLNLDSLFSSMGTGTTDSTSPTNSTSV
jgi:hypothetical protein